MNLGYAKYVLRMCLRWVVKTMGADRKRWSEMESGKFSGEKMMGAVACLWRVRDGRNGLEWIRGGEWEGWMGVGGGGRGREAGRDVRGGARMA